MAPSYSTTECPPYYRAELLKKLRLLLPTQIAVAQAIEALDHAEFITQLPPAEIADPYLDLLAAGGKLHAELLAFNIEAARRHGMEWRVYVDELLLPYVLAGVPLPGAPPRAGLAPYRPHVHNLAMLIVERNPTAPMSVVYSNPDARTHEQLAASFAKEATVERWGGWPNIEHKGKLEVTYGVMPRALLVGQHALPDDFLETAKVA
jgi:hypothetical protein